MQVPVFHPNGAKAGQIELPSVFLTPPRVDLIHRVFVAQQTHRKQPQGRDLNAGQKTSAKSWGVGRGVSRVPKTKGERYSKSGQAAGVASVVHGRMPHPPQAVKRIWKGINKRERLLATACAIAASASRELVEKRGHRLAKETPNPIVVTDEIEKLAKTRDLLTALQKLGLQAELRRIEKGQKKASGTPALRGRVRRTPRGPLIVVAKDGGISKAASGVLGVDWVLAKNLSVMHLAPGGHPGRLAIWSKSSLESLSPSLVRRVEAYAA